MKCCKACAGRFCDKLKTAGSTLLLARSRRNSRGRPGDVMGKNLLSCLRHLTPKDFEIIAHAVRNHGPQEHI
jgi:hypothetical protein